ncbi:hypothetical protein ACFYM5_04220 [Streptomyces sp. NPDC006706]|uniref:hypothetical protein n=1 Tax=Streptomyces sp. NPDC006706 TaxID=3364761 RepID=UPI00367DEE91
MRPLRDELTVRTLLAPWCLPGSVDATVELLARLRGRGGRLWRTGAVCPADELPLLPVAATVVDGRVVHRAGVGGTVIRPAAGRGRAAVRSQGLDGDGLRRRDPDAAGCERSCSVSPAPGRPWEGRPVRRARSGRGSRS